MKSSTKIPDVAFIYETIIIFVSNDNQNGRFSAENLNLGKSEIWWQKPSKLIDTDIVTLYVLG